MNLPTITEVHAHCKRPCATCPFRADRTPFMYKWDVRRNLENLLLPFRRAVCHYTVGNATISGRIRSRPLVPKMCAGFLLTLQKFGLPNTWLQTHDVSDLQAVPLYDSLADFAQRSECPVPERAGKAWVDCLRARRTSG